uniref:Microsomal glutathione S-transferase 1 n=1 Tax=Helicotheca tamesis TaxID=374047 RepID=A0A7S2H374_9STRA|mmetsp:Transcript_14890/g.20286  ORF Transcript_14890/g.20286 Transcript_14890/m.20286 type:complete len:158 (+) Transcript_14890:252-725(+)|eukprot:CAMPEP_0185730918 /NCGR_PEP_ID=MMETSP1171-20130828/11394_1 /TAXON_ID=374046 /ORGANISM="Helicotheca tamensis, Strain CCMP826" /LENGTH=157 /DNA_ID=CAMNT_0028400069 /DNA_START=199 /DNA_END=672 /DNA_ORIENTATION=+
MSNLLTTENPVFVTYALCVTILSLKMSLIAWHTVYHMVVSGGKGVRNPEDLLEGPCNPKPHPDDLKPYPPAERQRRMMGHDLENNVPFFAVGLIYVLIQAGPQWPLYSYTGTKVFHHLVYLTEQRHELRATVWTVTNSAFLYMSYLVLRVLLAEKGE